MSESKKQVVGVAWGNEELINVVLLVFTTNGRDLMSSKEGKMLSLNAERARDRLQVIRSHLICQPNSRQPRSDVQKGLGQIYFSPVAAKVGNVAEEVRFGLAAAGVTNVEVEGPPQGLEETYRHLLTIPALQFVADLTRHFNDQVDRMLKERIKKKVEIDLSGNLPTFPPKSEVRGGNWKVAPVPRRLTCRYLDLGDVTPADTDRFIKALQCDVDGIQTDFDDGHCPTWRGQLLGLHNVCRAVMGQLPGVKNISQVPILMLRPRAWNMIEHNMLVDGKEVPGPLFDFGLLMYHCATTLVAAESGPFFYLSKLEGANEARLWNYIFCWAQDKLNIPHGTVKACVLIENVLASFEMEEILYELRHHSLGLNCGIWDYSASFVNKFGHRQDFVLPDRNKYVNMQRHFLRSYMDLVVQTCHKHGAFATGGMAATILKPRDLKTITQVTSSKARELVAGVDGFMVYDMGFVPIMKKLIAPRNPNQLEKLREDVVIKPFDLLTMPSGGVTLEGLKHNIAVGVLFIEAWLRGKGHYIFRGAVEDSATAEISRSQVWQWIRHRATLEDNGEVITRGLVQKLVCEFVKEAVDVEGRDRETIQIAAEIFEEVVTKREFPEFLTTYLNLDHTFLAHQKQLVD
ncbi:hypothetical protein Pmani_026589 [Petrolisthes manimaculis]|uniref:malate synthase n=1 Tax=Petrolisthes manimaculis TaxID=1843537 RepID=A0AAE1P3C5_9EUCA|nr:hypothetical protein Pmani_026589 [Petrolisthes manimaculis]